MGVGRDGFDLHTERSTHPSINTLTKLIFHSLNITIQSLALYSRNSQNMYLDRLWTMRQYAGFSDAKSTNKRFLELLDNGQSGLSVAFDLPTQLGLNSNSDLAEGK